MHLKWFHWSGVGVYIYIYIYALCSVGIHGVYGISCTTYIYAYAYIYVCIYDCFSSNCLGRLHGSVMVSAELVHTSCSGSIYDACIVPFKRSIHLESYTCRDSCFSRGLINLFWSVYRSFSMKKYFLNYGSCLILFIFFKMNVYCFSFFVIKDKFILL